MILRGAFWVGMVWLALPHLPGMDAAAPAAPGAVIARLHAIKDEIRDESKSPMVARAAEAGENLHRIARLLPHDADPAALLAAVRDRAPTPGR